MQFDLPEEIIQEIVGETIIKDVWGQLHDPWDENKPVVGKAQTWHERQKWVIDNNIREIEENAITSHVRSVASEFEIRCRLLDEGVFTLYEMHRLDSERNAYHYRDAPDHPGGSGHSG